MTQALATTTELLELLPYLTEPERAELDRLLQSNPVWTPQAGKQALAYACEADELFYGGAAGGGKTDLILGLAGTAHRHSVIFRREYPRLRGIIERSHQIFDAVGRYNDSSHIWRLDDGRVIELGALQYEKDKEDWRGRAHDFYAFDEITEFSESQFRFVTGWLRTTVAGQQCRIVCTGNPPSDAQGEWVIQYWAAWLDPQHPRPAQPGELRWFAMIDGKHVEVESGAPFEHDGETITPRSRTFIPARLEDNPILEATGYRAQLQNLPEPLRSQMLYGDFGATHTDDVWQCIPTAWVLAAQARWETTAKPDLALKALGVDVARGGIDNTVIAPIYGTWFDTLIVHPGVATPDGPTVARYVTDVLGDSSAPVYIDVIGVGTSAYDALSAVHASTIPVNNSSRSDAKDKSGRYGFANLRAESYWKLREALDPSSGEAIALPPSRELRVDLCAPRYKVTGGKYQLESKEDIKKRTGRSPDYGDAVVLAWYGASRPINLVDFA